MADDKNQEQQEQEQEPKQQPKKDMRADTGPVEDKTEGPKLVLRGDKPMRIEPKKPVNVPQSEPITTPDDVIAETPAAPPSPNGNGLRLEDVEREHAAAAMQATATPAAPSAGKGGIGGLILWVSFILLALSAYMLAAALGYVPQLF